MTLLELAERVRASTGPDRELDAKIAVAVKWRARGPTADDHEYLSIPRKDDGCAPGTYWFHCRSGMSLRTAPEWCASIDAAMMLVPDDCLTMVRELWDVGHKAGQVVIAAYVASGEEPDGKIWVNDFTTVAATPALALTATALRVRAAMEGEG